MTTTQSSPLTIGILGGGQLGKLFIQQNHPQAVQQRHLFLIYSPEKPLILNDPEFFHSLNITWVQGNLNNPQTIFQFGQQCDIITIEIENINVSALEQLQAQGKQIYPSPNIINLIKNKRDQKRFLQTNNFPTSNFQSYQSISEVNHDKLCYPLVNKLQVGGYDGRGVQIINEPDPSLFFTNLFGDPSIIEDYVDIKKELSIIVGRSPSGKITHLPLSEMVSNSETNMLDYLICPAQVPRYISQRAIDLAFELAKAIDLVGILAIELFLTQDDQLLINELAPRPHNSGHHTIDCCTPLNQYTLLYQCITDQLSEDQDRLYNPSGPTLMVNLVGSTTQQPNTEYNFKSTLFNDPKFKLYNYHKPELRANRKMGHLTYCSQTNLSPTEISNLVTQMKHAYLLFTNPTVTQPLVSVIMGSSSDLPMVKPAIEILRDFSVPHEVKVVSAHRTPHFMLDYASQLTNRGVKVVIAAAGGAAHLPGMVASATTLPVIGIPVKSHNSLNGGLDSLLSIVQMPGGVPVATMAVDGAKNAGLYAVRILSTSDPKLNELMAIYQQILEQKVEKMNRELKFN